jgi:hypothetical protein
LSLNSLQQARRKLEIPVRDTGRHRTWIKGGITLITKAIISSRLHLPKYL